MAVEAPVSHLAQDSILLVNATRKLIPSNQAIFPASTPPQAQRTLSHQQSNKKYTQQVAVAQGIWLTMIPIDRRSPAKARMSSHLPCGRNRCPTIPDEVCKCQPANGPRSWRNIPPYVNTNADLQVVRPMRISPQSQKRNGLDRNRSRN